jgi:signal transduction histidine kinase
MNSFTARVIGALLLSLIAVAAPANPKRVLMLHSFGPDFGDEYAKDLRAEIDRRLPGEVDLYESWLISARFATREGDTAFASYLKALFSDHPLDLVVTLGAPAADFVEKYRQPLFAATPVLLTDIEERRVARVHPGANDTAVPFSVDVSALVKDILQVLPQTTRMFVVIGNSPIERYWVKEIDASLQAFNDRLSVVWLNELPFNDLLERVAKLPPRSVILFALVSPEVVGIPKDEDTALAKLHQAADAPIFSYLDAYFGEGVVGGPMISGDAFTREAADAAVRILRGERAADINEATLHLATPQFDWRELTHWNIRESNLPRGSAIRFREPSVWERYRWQIASIIILLLLETALIFNLLYERRRRKHAEVEAHQRIAELAHMNRRSTVGELSASIAHELSQPLGAILRNSEAADLMLEARVPDLDGLRDILADIRRDEHRASEVIRRLRQLLAKAPLEAQEVDLNGVVREVFEFLSAQAAARHVTLSTSLDARAPRVRADRIQLQQVILNLVMNSVEAIGSAQSAERRVVGCTRVLENNSAEVAIEDSGPGIPGDTFKRLFEPFFTTKAAGMGMGLSIARTIVESHGGRIWAENQSSGGAVFRFTLPLAARPEAQPLTRSSGATTRSAPGIDRSAVGAEAATAP